MLQVSLVVIKLFGAIDEGLVAALLFLFKLLDLLINCVIGKFGQEHFFLLIDEFVDILCALLPRELHPTPSNVHGLVNVILLFQVEVLFLRVMLTR